MGPSASSTTAAVETTLILLGSENFELLIYNGGESSLVVGGLWEMPGSLGTPGKESLDLVASSSGQSSTVTQETPQWPARVTFPGPMLQGKLRDHTAASTGR